MDLYNSCWNDLNIHEYPLKRISTENQLLCYHAEVKCAAATCDSFIDSKTNPNACDVQTDTEISISLILHPFPTPWIILKVSVLDRYRQYQPEY